MPMRGSQSESGGANGERSGPPWRSRPGPRKQSLGNWLSWRGAPGPMDRRATSMSSALLELCCLGAALGSCSDPQGDLRHLAANAACSPAPLARPEEQGEDARRAAGLEECHQRGQFLLQRVGHQVFAAP